MSYDVDIEINTGIQMHCVEDVGNYTYNVGSMFKLAFAAAGCKSVESGNDSGCHSFGLGDLTGFNCAAAVPILKKAVEYMHTHVEELEKLTPENGWGSYRGAVSFLEAILAACERHPFGTIRVS